MNERVMPCAVCGQAIGKYVCRKCGKLVCEDCYDKKSGVCVYCS